MVKVIGALWMGIGLTFGASSIWNLFYNSDVTVNVVLLVVSVASIIGGTATVLNKPWARILVGFPAIVFLLYGVTFIFFGGFADSDTLTSVVVLLLFWFSLTSLVILFMRWVDG